MSANPSHVGLLELIGAGAEVGEFAHAAREAMAKGKGFSYALAIVRGRRQEATRLADGAASQASPARRWEPPDEEEDQHAQA